MYTVTTYNRLCIIYLINSIFILFIQPHQGLQRDYKEPRLILLYHTQRRSKIRYKRKESLIVICTPFILSLHLPWLLFQGPGVQRSPEQLFGCRSCSDVGSPEFVVWVAPWELRLLSLGDQCLSWWGWTDHYHCCLSLYPAVSGPLPPLSWTCLGSWRWCLRNWSWSRFHHRWSCQLPHAVPALTALPESLI